MRTQSIVVDSNVFIDNLRGLESARRFFDSVRNDSSLSVCYSAITEAELLSGKECENEEKVDRILELLSIGEKILVTNEIAKSAGAIRRKYNLTLLDALIAATALSVGSVLYSRNIGAFKAIPDLETKEPYKY